MERKKPIGRGFNASKSSLKIATILKFSSTLMYLLAKILGSAHLYDLVVLVVLLFILLRRYLAIGRMMTEPIINFNIFK